MTRKDYILLVDALREAHPHMVHQSEEREQWQVDCESIADALARDNPRFDRARFLTACGIKE